MYKSFKKIDHEACLINQGHKSLNTFPRNFSVQITSLNNVQIARIIVRKKIYKNDNQNSYL